MPDKPKRRKNNKNKRKNKNNNWQYANKNNSGAKEVPNNEECSVSSSQTELDGSISDTTGVLKESDCEIKSEESSNILKFFTLSNQNTIYVNRNSNNERVAEEKSNDSVKADHIKQIEIEETSDLLNYVVESPEQSANCIPKLVKTIKSKSLDNEDETKIVEITEKLPDDNLHQVNYSNVHVSEVESDVEWETANNFQDNLVSPSVKSATGKLSITCIPLTVAQCDQNKSLTPEEELSLRQYLDTLNLSTQAPDTGTIEMKTEIEEIITREVKHRLRKKGYTDDFIPPRLGPARHLDVIDEESGESCIASRRQSYLSEKKSDNDDLEDDVFEDKNKPCIRLEKCPPAIKIRNKNLGRQIHQQCVLVDAKIKEPDVMEARGDWSVQTVEKMAGAEVVYLTDSSSSTSSVYDLNDEIDEGVETDASIRMITPTIEVTDTERLLKESFLNKSEKNPTRQNSESKYLTDNKIPNPKSETSFEDMKHNINNHSTTYESPEYNPHEIVVLSTDDIKSSLYVKDLEDKNGPSENNEANCADKNLHVNRPNPIKEQKHRDLDLEMKVLKCEMNVAFNNLISEYASDTESSENHKEQLNRQDSSSSVGSSQCTAKYNPTSSSLNDVSNILHDEMNETSKKDSEQTHTTTVASHVKDVFECVTGSQLEKGHARTVVEQPLFLRDLCVKKIAAFPYGDKILEELASVSERLQNINIYGSGLGNVTKEQNHTANSNKTYSESCKMPYYPLPDVSAIDKVSLPTKPKESAPPPIQPRNSSLKKPQDESHWTGIPTQQEPVYVCLSPSQKMLMERTNTILTKEDASQLVNMHKKYVDRRGYNEYYDKKSFGDPPTIPFKSQTGSRLLALIQDPAATNNIHSSQRKSYHNSSVDQLQNNYENSESKHIKKYGKFNLARNIMQEFKPIPPPRPKKLASHLYESDESSDFTDNSLRSVKSERKFFHYSTGNLSKEIENDVSSIQDMHRRYVNVRESVNKSDYPRRPSLPKDLCEQQMEYIRQKEKEVEAEIRRLEQKKLNVTNSERKGRRAPLITEKEEIKEQYFNSDKYHISRKRDVAFTRNKSPEKGEKSKISSIFSSSQEELQRDKMYSEYMTQMAERQERKQQKIIKITNTSSTKPRISAISKSMSALNILDSKINNPIEKEFICKARERWDKLGIKDPETEDEKDDKGNVYREPSPKVIEHRIKVIECGEERDVRKLPSHLQEFVRLTAKDKEKGTSSPAVWRPGVSPTAAPAPAAHSPAGAPPPPPPPVWSPGASPQAPRKNFRPVHFEETPPARRKFESTPPEQNGCASASEGEGRLRTSHSAPATGLSSLGTPLSPGGRLPRAQNPTVTLLQKAREGQIARGSNLQQERDAARLPRDRASPPRGDPVHALRREYASEGEAEREERGRGKMADARHPVDGVGPTTKDGMPVTLRSEVKDPTRWYKKMYDTIHKNKYDDDYVTIRYKSRRGQPPQRVTNKSHYAYFDPRSGYLSEPEGGQNRLGGGAWSDAYDSDVTTGPRRRTASVQEDRRNDNELQSPYLPTNKYSTLASARARQEVYKNQPGRIENYVPGKSSVVDQEAKQWWDEVMDIFDGQLSSTTSLPQAIPKEKKDVTSAILSKSNMARALKESGYESDSTLVFRRRDSAEGPLSPAERRAAYRDLQAGGEPPLRGFRSPAPPRTDDTEIEYIPISPTLTKIRVHKKNPNGNEVICYPITSFEPVAKFKKLSSSVISDVPSGVTEYPPAPPRRVSSKHNRTLKLVDATRTKSSSPRRQPLLKTQSNVDFLRDKISHKLTRQNTHIISKKESYLTNNKMSSNINKGRVISTSAPPAINRKSVTATSNGVRKTDPKHTGTSSFGSPRRTLLPTEYSSTLHTRHYTSPSTSVVIEGGAGRRTPVTNILDRVTSLDKLWSAEKRNEPLDKVKAKASLSKTTSGSKLNGAKISSKTNSKNISPGSRGRDMIRTAEKVQKLKSSNHAKSTPCLASKAHEAKPFGNAALSVSKSSSSIAHSSRKPNLVKTAVVTNLKKKKSVESDIIRPRSSPCHTACSKRSKESSKDVSKKLEKLKSTKNPRHKSANYSETGSQFGDTVYEISNFGSTDDISNGRLLTAKEIKDTRDAVISDSFFQHLFLGGSSGPVMTYPLLEPNTNVLQKARMFQSYPQDYSTPKSINSYLIHRKPVSLSRFKLCDRYPSPARPQSPRSISWPGRIHTEVRKFDSLSKCDEFGSTSSLATVRSRSEPPVNKMYFSQTTRPKSPTVVFFKKDKSKSPPKIIISPPKMIFSQTSRPVSPKIVRRVAEPVKLNRNQSISPTRIVFTETSRPISPTVKRRVVKKPEPKPKEEDKVWSTMYFSETSRPVSPKVVRKSSSGTVSRSQSTSPVSMRSPSYRRIHSARLQNSKSFSTPSKPILRTRSAGDAEKKCYEANISKTKSDTNLLDTDYDEYVRDMENTKIRSERFRELNRYYTYLERVGELEKATSVSDLRHRRKDEEIIDFDRWKKIRAIERAEEELNDLYYKLKSAQSDNDVLFYPRDVNDFRWSFDKDRGLRIKEKSVEDLKDQFQHSSYYETIEGDLPLSKDTYKPLWRGTSVAETAFNINRKNDKKVDCKELKFGHLKPNLAIKQDSSMCELRKKIGLGNRLWSSLSMEQVNALKNQLNAIYSKDFEAKSNKDLEKFSVEVKDSKSVGNSQLHVRSNSLVTSSLPPVSTSEMMSKSESIAAISCPITSVKELKNNVNKIQMSLSENEKRKISQTLSKEVLNRIKKIDGSPPPIPLKQEMEMCEAKEHIEQTKLKAMPSAASNTSSIETITPSPDGTWEEKRSIIFPSDKSETAHQSSASETETGSDASNRTVIYKGTSREVLKKIEYFESVKNTTPQIGKTVYHAREDSDDKDTQGSKKVITAAQLIESNEKQPQKTQITQSQSCTNFKELFGESTKNIFLSLPAKPERYSRSPSPRSEVYVSDRRTPDTLRCSSEETIWRSRSPSPERERYWRAYLRLARAGEVRRLARRFDSPSTASNLLRRHRSDPELNRNLTSWSSTEGLNRSRQKTMLPVVRVPLRAGNRFMPHIDIISKLAALRRRTAPRSRSAEEAFECRPGEVNRIRRRFEVMSLLGEIYASAPDVSELQDIAPYLSGSWIAHRYPKKSDNNKSIEDPSTLVRGRTSPIRKEVKPAVAKEPVKLSSILKSDIFAKQEFDPSVHRPASRYEPPRAPPRPPPTSWPYRLAPLVTPSRHSVKFQEADSAPEPPRRAPYGSSSDTESPRRYVESDVNIHYRCPVRRAPLPLVPERELARQQAEHMQRLYREQKRTKYLQDLDVALSDVDAFDASIKELQDMQSRRHQDNFTPSQKAVVPLNRYDEADRVIAKALYAFNGQTVRELSFRKGDLIHVRRQIDANWYEGELHGRVGLFPYNYVEIIKGDAAQSPKKPAAVEGRARAKFDFTAQTNLELPLKKGEVVVLTRRIDHNWWEGRNGAKTGIFPDSYVQVLQEPSPSKPEPPPMLNKEKPVASPAGHGLLTSSARRSMGAHSYMPQLNSPALSNAPPATQPLPAYSTKASQPALTPSERGYGPPAAAGVDLNNTEPLYVDTNAEAIPYRAMYKYRPQNPDELELNEGDTVYVLEKCDDGWYVGSSQRTGRFGTFPGNYVERI